MTHREQQYPHRHRWVAASVHQVSDGVVIYQRCDCGGWRVARAEPVLHIDLGPSRRNA